jgi:hypothetical protein
VPSGLSAHLLAIFGRAGIDPGTVVIIGALFGPSQVAARLAELAFARHVRSLNVARVAVAALLAGCALFALWGFTALVAAIFMLMFGIANGLMTLARGAVPLALFGPVGYGHIIGRIGGACLLTQAIAPLALAFVMEHGSDQAALITIAGFGCISFLALLAVRQRNESEPSFNHNS